MTRQSSFGKPESAQNRPFYALEASQRARNHFREFFWVGLEILIDIPF